MVAVVNIVIIPY